MLLYIHVPFCRTKCNYCAFHSVPLGKGVEPLQSLAFKEYMDTLLLELAVWGDKYNGTPVRSIFFGGGTPSLLPARMVHIILERIQKMFTLGDSHNGLSTPVEVTLEANPESLRNKRHVYDLAKAGVNRLSIGLQSLDDEYLRMLGRSHKVRDSLYAVMHARECGISNINVDLMWALPGQGVKHWLNTLREVTRMKPTHISAYGLTLEQGTKLELQYEEGLLQLPPERDQSTMFMEGAALLEEQGYLHYEISNFARMGFQCRHNLGYWEGSDYIGLGPSATSTVQGRRWTNPMSQKAWAHAVQERTLDANSELLSPKERVLELVMLRLRTSRGLRIKAYKAITGRNFMEDNAKLIQALHENGLIRIRHGYLRLTRSGMLVSNSILSNLFAHTENCLEGILDNDSFLERGTEHDIENDTEVSED